MSQPYLVGIDFGACNLKVAASAHGRTLNIKLNKQASHNAAAPNLIFYKKKKETDGVDTLIGDIARREWRFHPEETPNVIDDIKRKLEQSQWSQRVPNLGRDITAGEAAQDVFAFLYQTVQGHLDDPQQPIESLVTVPVCFSAMQRRRIRAAAERAGWHVRAIRTEPFAALFSENLWDELLEEEEQLVVICDFGGSTLDLSLLRIENEDGLVAVEELASYGLHYGGRDIDESLYRDILCKKYEEEISAVTDPQFSIVLEARLREVSTQLKERICQDEADEDEETVVLPDGTSEDVTLTMDEIVHVLEEAHLKERMEAAVGELLRQADETKEHVTRVAAFGGTCRIPYVLGVLDGLFDCFDSTEVDVGEDDAVYFPVARGAASYLKILYGDTDVEIEIKDRMPFDIGLLHDGVFESCMHRGLVVGDWSKNKRVTWQDIASWGGKIPLYQHIHGDLGSGSPDVYVGSIAVDRAKYEDEEQVLLQLKEGADDTIVARLRELRGPEGARHLETVEELPVQIGDESDA